MRRLVLGFIAISMLASCKLRSLASVVSFEGEIDMSMGASTTTTFKLKGTKMRTEAGGFASITDADTKKMWTLDTSSRTYTETDLAALSKAASTSAKPKSSIKSINTGRSDTVAGRSCDVYEVVDTSAPASAPIELCLATGLNMIALGLSGPFSAFSQGDDGWSEVFSHGFPLRITMRDPGGKPLMTLQATRVEKKSEPDSEFRVPAGYTKM